MRAAHVGEVGGLHLVRVEAAGEIVFHQLVKELDVLGERRSQLISRAVAVRRGDAAHELAVVQGVFDARAGERIEVRVLDLLPEPEELRHALDQGFRDISIAIGGSATNDGGMGCLRALGVRFLDADGVELAGVGADLERVARIDVSGLHPRVAKVGFTAMCDVDNPLCGPDGATYTFGAQKGATPEIQARLERGMQNYRDVIVRDLGMDPDEIAGSGAAGGLGAALAVFLHAELKSGIESVLDLTGFDERGYSKVFNVLYNIFSIERSVDRERELLLRAVNNRTRERNFFRLYADYLEKIISEEEYERLLEEQQDEYVLPVPVEADTSDIETAVRLSGQIKDVESMDDFQSLFSFSDGSIHRAITAQ